MTGNRLLEIAETMCGPDARRPVFEPLVADWQRECRDRAGAERMMTTAEPSEA